jgi:outer membrane protein assembly factor BamB
MMTFSVATLSTQHSALSTSLAVIPTLGLLGPLAFLAAVLPAVFGGLMFGVKRWSGLLAALSLMSAWYFLHHMAGMWGHRSWLRTAAGLWLILAVLAVPFAFWSAWRYQRAVWAGAADRLQPRRSDRIVFLLLTVTAGLALVGGWQRGADLLRSPWLELSVMAVAITAGLAYLIAARRTQPAALAGETVVLWALAGACLSAAALEVGRSKPTNDSAGVALPRKVWSFQPDGIGQFAGPSLVAGERVYVAGAFSAGFRGYGVLFALDRLTGREVWRFDHGGELKPVFSAPCLADGRLYFGEGFHEDNNCRVLCVDAATGQKVWQFATQSHTESGPCVAGGRVFIGAGDDGLYCLDAATGEQVWHFTGLHVDGGPAVVGGRVFAGSYAAPGNRFDATELFCLDATTGARVWRAPVELSAFGAPAVEDGRAYFAIGNGNFQSSVAKPAGAVLCLDAATGQRLWRRDLPDGVLCRPVLDGDAVYFGCRDGRVYALDRGDGRVRWTSWLGSPAVAAPTVLAGPDGRTVAVYAVASGGEFARLDPATGEPLFTLSVPAHAGATGGQFYAASVVQRDSTGRRRTYLAAGLSNALATTPRLFCFEDADE